MVEALLDADAVVNAKDKVAISSGRAFNLNTIWKRKLRHTCFTTVSMIHVCSKFRCFRCRVVFKLNTRPDEISEEDGGGMGHFFDALALCIKLTSPLPRTSIPEVGWSQVLLLLLVV